MTTITPELLAEIREKAEKASDTGNIADWILYHPRIMLAILAALEAAQRERDAAVKAHNDLATELTAAQTMAGEETLKADALRAENEKLRAAIERTCDVGRIINDGSTYARGWNDALFSARAINNIPLKETTHAD